MAKTETKVIEIKVNIESAVSKITELQKSIGNITNVSIDSSSIKSLQKELSLLQKELGKEVIERKNRASVIDNLVSKEVSELSKLGNYYSELEKRSKDYYNSDISNKQQALDLLSKNLQRIRQEIDATEYSMIGQSNPKGRHSIAKDQEDTAQYLRLLQEEAIKTENAMEALSNVKMGGTSANINKINNDLTETNFELLQMREYYKQLEIESAKQAKTTKAKEQAEKQLSIQKEKQIAIDAKNAADAAKKVGYINELKISVNALEQEYYQLTEAELKSAKGTELLSSLKNKRAELMQLQQAYGNNTLNIGNYSSATKMLGINIGQVMKEMPNFAISARIGIMSLTNNLPMLAETIKQVRVEQLAMIAAGKKAPSMFSLISKSVFGLTGIMSIAMVLMQLYGGEIIEWIGTLFKGEKAVEGLTNAQLGLNTTMETFNKTMKDGGGVYGSAISSIQKHKVALDAAKGSSELSKAALDDYNTSLGVTFGKATDVNGALKLIRDNENDYIAAMKNMAFANAFFSQSADDAVKIIERTTAKNFEILGDNSTKYVEAIEKAQKAIKDANDNTTSIGEALTVQYNNINKEVLYKNLADAEKAYNDAAAKERARQIEEIRKNQNISLQQAEKYYNEYADIFEKNKWKVIDTQKDVTTKVTQTALAQFDYESKIMEERAKSLEVGRERELAAVDADYNAKLVRSQQHIDKLKQQEAAGVKGAKEARIQAEKQQEEYELALEEGKGRKKIEINLKYDKLQADNALAELKHQHDMMIAENELSAKEQYDLTVKTAQDEFVLKMEQLDLMNISDEEYVLKRKELFNQMQLAIANGEKKLTNDLYTENQARLNNELLALTTGRDAQFQDIDAVYNKKLQILNDQKEKEVEKAGANAELIKSIEAKYAAESVALEDWKTTSKVDKYKFLADTALNVGSEVNKAITAFAEHELSVWAKANEGKANFDVEYEKKKIDLQRKAAIREKALGVMSATINTAASIIKMLADPGGIAGVALSVAAGITGAAQIAAILATPLPSISSSSVGSSAKVEKKTVTEKFHTGGEVKTSPTGVETPATLLGGESVNTIATTQMFSPLLSALNQLGGGKAITSGVANTGMGTDMLASAFSKALRNMPAPILIMEEFEKASEKHKKIQNNRIIR